MSIVFLCQICHNKKLNNRQLSEIIVNKLRANGINIKQAARDLDLSVSRVRNWYYKKTGMTALDLLKMMREYEFVRQAVQDFLLIPLSDLP